MSHNSYFEYYRFFERSSILVKLERMKSLSEKVGNVGER